MEFPALFPAQLHYLLSNYLLPTTTEFVPKHWTPSEKDALQALNASKHFVAHSRDGRVTVISRFYSFQLPNGSNFSNWRLSRCSVHAHFITKTKSVFVNFFVIPACLYRECFCAAGHNADKSLLAINVKMLVHLAKNLNAWVQSTK